MREYGTNKKVYMERYRERAKKQNGEERSKKVEGSESGSGLSMSSGSGLFITMKLILNYQRIDPHKLLWFAPINNPGEEFW